jgi:hypothetical protein
MPGLRARAIRALAWDVQDVYPMIPAGATYRDIIMGDEDLEGLSKETQGSNV